jgi:hypothetical protein
MVASLAAAALCLVALPAAGATSPAAREPRAYHSLTLGHGESSVNVCSYALAPGTAHCNAQIRTDTDSHQLQPARHDGTTSATLGDNGAYSPAYLQSAYNIASADAAHGGGVGQVVAIVDAYDDPNLASDLAYYRSYFSLPACASGVVSLSATGCVFEKVNQSGASSPLPATNASWGVETSLDVEMVSAICPACEILVVEATSASIANLGAAVDTAVAMGADVVSNSYGSSEYSSENNDSNTYYNHPGVPIVVASGDNGYGVEFPAASPDVVAVGGTSLTQNSATGTRNGTETVWSGAGAGCSAYEAKPAWQHDTGCARRTVADVAAVANPSTGVWVYDTYGESGFAIYGGTSVATPIISSIFALAGNALGTTNYPASYLYANAGALTSVTSGSDGNCGTYLCNAADSQNGYNGPTGLGTPGASPNSLAAFSASSGTSAPPTVPSAPTLTSATAGNGSVTLNWSAPASTGGSPITGYNVFVGTAAGGESATAVNAAPLTSTTLTVGSLTNATTYYFVVEALNAVGASAASNELSATPIAASVPGAPTLNSAKAASGSVTLNWSAPASTGGSALTGYFVYLGTSAGGESTSALNSTPLTGTGAIVSGLTNGTTYYFKVTAANALGVSASSNELSATPATTPGAPSSLSATKSSTTGVNLTWKAPSSTGGSPITSYELYRGTRSGQESAYVAVSCSSSSCSYNDTGTTSGTTYYYQVAAVNAIGAGTKSPQVSSAAK